MFRKLCAVVLIAAVIASEFGVYGTGFVGTAHAQGTPQIISINPSSPAPVGTNVSIRATVQWDSDFRSMRICFRDENWCQEDGTPDITKNFDTSGLGAGTYTIIAEVSAQNQGWDTATKTYASYELTSVAQPTQSPPQPQPTQEPQPSTPPQGPSISEVSFNPSGGVQVGQSVTIHIRVDSSNPGAIRVTQPCGSLSHVETTVPEFDDIWNTSGCGEGTQNVQVCARDVNDPNWANATCTKRAYSLYSPPAEAPTANFWSDAASIQAGQCTVLHWSTGNATSVNIDGTGVSTSGSMEVCPAITKHYSLGATGAGGTASRSLTVEVYAGSVPTSVANPTSSFQTGDIIKIGLDVYVIVNGSRRHVPNPETLDALGISQNEVNNKGFSDTQLSMISKGSDIPDVNKDPSGFAAFKATYFASRSPIVPGGQSGQGPTGTSGTCPNAPALFKPGDIGVVTDYQPSRLNIRTRPGLNNPIIGKIPIYAYASIIAGPQCADGYRWWEVGYEGVDGWSAEVGPDGLYNLIPNTMPMHGGTGSPGTGGNGAWVNPAPTPTPTPTPAPAPQQQAATSPSVAEPVTLAELAQQALDWLKSINPFGHFDLQAAGYVNTSCDPQCVKAAGEKRTDLYLWAPGAGTPNRILEIALKEPSFPVGNDQYKVKVRGQDEAPKAGDLIIWPNGCGGSWGGGHIGYIESGNPLRITDSNWPSVPGPVCSRRNDQPLTLSSTEKGCVRFIIAPYRVSAATQPAGKCSQYSGFRWLWCKITGK